MNRSAHALKGAVGNFAANQVHETALRMENLARDGNIVLAKNLFTKLDRQIAQLLPALSALVRKEAA